MAIPRNFRCPFSSRCCWTLGPSVHRTVLDVHPWCERHSLEYHDSVQRCWRQRLMSMHQVRRSQRSHGSGWVRESSKNNLFWGNPGIRNKLWIDEFLVCMIRYSPRQVKTSQFHLKIRNLGSCAFELMREFLPPQVVTAGQPCTMLPRGVAWRPAVRCWTTEPTWKPDPWMAAHRFTMLIEQVGNSWKWWEMMVTFGDKWAPKNTWHTCENGQPPKKIKTECKKKCAVYFGGALHWRLQKVGEWSEFPLIGDAFK